MINLCHLPVYMPGPFGWAQQEVLRILFCLSHMCPFKELNPQVPCCFESSKLNFFHNGGVAYCQLSHWMWQCSNRLEFHSTFLEAKEPEKKTISSPGFLTALWTIDALCQLMKERGKCKYGPNSCFSDVSWPGCNFDKARCP
jgi:hypothetical protein